jgi:hypothetical protein
MILTVFLTGLPYRRGGLGPARSMPCPSPHDGLTLVFNIFIAFMTYDGPQLNGVEYAFGSVAVGARSGEGTGVWRQVWRQTFSEIFAELMPTLVRRVRVR